MCMSTGTLFSLSRWLAAPNLKNRPRPRPRLLRNLAPEQTVHYLAFGESASQQRLVYWVVAPSSTSSSSSSISCLAERPTSDIKACPCLAAYPNDDGNFVLVSW